MQLVGQKYRDKTNLASKTRFIRHCFGFQDRRFSLLVGYNIQPSSSSTNQNAALITDRQLVFTKKKDRRFASMIEYYKDSSPVVEPEGHIKVLKWILLMVQASVVILRHIFLETPHRALSQTGILHSPYRTLMKSSSSQRLAQQSTYSPCH